jgi:cellulose synthase/poly-beta-1,6-N-acetylglucosamine synthase-like glycosyltransferase
MPPPLFFLISQEVEHYMTIEGSQYTVGNRNLLDEAEKLITTIQSERVQGRLQSENEPILQVGSPAAYDLSIVIPTRNERDNILPLLDALQRVLCNLSVEIIFVDDSDDDTPQIIGEAAKMRNSPLLHILLDHRLPGAARAGGLATAVVNGMSKAHAEYIAVLDADLQHPPELLRIFYEQAVTQNVDLVLASRYIKGGSYQGLANRRRQWISRGLKDLARLLFIEHLRQISDPLGGFFLVRRALLTNVALHPIGYKIQLELLLRCPWQSVLEVPYHFRSRVQGKSKANLRQGLLVLAHMRKLWLEVPSAGRIWKIVIMLFLNIITALVVFTVNKLSPEIASNLTIASFGGMAVLNFLLAARFIFPYSRITSPAAPAASLTSEDEETLKLPVIKPAEPPVPDRNRVGRSIGKRKIPHNLPLIAATVAVVFSVIWMSYTKQGALLSLTSLFIGATVLCLNRVSRERAITMLLAVGVSVATIDYISWRFAVTNWRGWWVAVPLLFAETLGALHVLGFQLTVWPWRSSTYTRDEDPTQHPIFVFIPTVNEGVTILKPTLEGIIAARDKYLAHYPHGKVTIVICNDGRRAGVADWEEVDELAKALGVCCVTRTEGGGAKAGNIENARQLMEATGDALVAIFDADQVAKPDFFLRTIPPFSDSKMGWVQTGQYYANLDNPTSRWADDQQSMFYNLLCPGKAVLSAAFICGTNVVIRAAALDQIGGLPQNSVTEDFAASISLHPYWRSTYLTEVLATGLGPLDIPSYLKQQSRWAIGTLGVLRTHLREILLPRKGGLGIGQRLQYFLACTHYLCGLRDLIYVISPILFIFTGVPSVGGTTLNEYLWHFIPYILLSSLMMWYSARDITGLRGIIIGFGSFPVLISSLLTVILGRKVRFTVTSKHRSKKRSLGYLRVYFFLLLICLVALVWMALSESHQRAALFISGAWVVYSIIMLGSFLWLSYLDLRFQKAAQQSKASQSVEPYPAKLLQRRRKREAVWSFGIAALLAVPVLINSSLGTLAFSVHGSATPFVMNQEHRSAPYFGLSLPIQLLNSQPPVLERLLDTQFSIIGRTQDIRDIFDTAWAGRLTAQHARPWITLQFGEFGPDHKPPLDANLPAIINGLHDQNLRRWAEEIREYGKPVYMTVFLHADRNWSVSSGVANGGIPQDVSKAWLHVQSVFRVVGADNVAWVWAPADPLHDQPYAPPASAIDAVLQSFIGYPRTLWGNPVMVLSDLMRRYPTKPIIVEASVDGPDAQKAAWLTQLGRAIHTFSHIYALLYHEGGPDLRPTPAQVSAWSLASGPESLAVMRRIVAGLDAHISP